MPRTNVQPQGSTNHDSYSTHCTSAWAFSGDVAREQHALETLKRADEEFARALTRALLPDPTPANRDVLRRVAR